MRADTSSRQPIQIGSLIVNRDVAVLRSDVSERGAGGWGTRALWVLPLPPFHTPETAAQSKVHLKGIPGTRGAQVPRGLALCRGTSSVRAAGRVLAGPEVVFNPKPRAWPTV